MCGDYNSKPDSSVVHRILNKPYLLTESSGRIHPETGLKAYKDELGRSVFNQINKDIEDNKEHLKGVTGIF